MALENIEQKRLRRRFFFAFVVGIVFVAVTSALTIPASTVILFEHLHVGNPLTRRGYAIFIFVTLLIMPGMLGAMALGGNVHAYHWWVAAVVNGFVYFGIGWVLHGILGRLGRKGE